MRLGIVGAGTMGAGVAQVAAQSGFLVRMYDIGEQPLQAGLSRIRSGLEKHVQRGKLSADERDATMGRISTTSSLEAFEDVDFVVEAAPEVLELKRQIFEQLDRICRPEVVLATNTSSLSVTEIGALTRRQELVVGMHFFNPVPLMKLVEVVKGARTSQEAAAQTTELAVRLGKTPVQAKDTPGFIVNRIARPFPGEALRLVGDNVAGIAQVDRVAKLGAGFRMGPFELMDLVGMDINFAVNKSVFEQFFFEPRFRPHPLQAQRVKANLLGRKTGQGWYRYDGDQIVGGPQGAEFFGNPGPRPEGVQKVWILDDAALAELVTTAGYTITEDASQADVVIWGNPHEMDDLPYKEGALVLQEASWESVGFMRTNAPEGRIVGYGGVPSVAQRQLVEVAVPLGCDPSAWQLAVQFLRSLGRDVEVVQSQPGLVALRIIACLVNEAAYALMEGVATPADIDTAMKLGVNYPKGPLEWADEIGPNVILRTLTNLFEYTGDPRYRPCPYLKELVWAGLKFHGSQH